MGFYLGAAELSTGGGGGGGFTKMNKYSTNRAIGGDTVNNLPVPSISGITYSNTAAGATTFVWYDQSGGPYLRGDGVYNGWTFINNSTTYTVTSTVDNGSNQYTMVFSPALTAAINSFVPIVMLSDQFFTVNPATDLGLEDGASIYIFMVSGGQSSTTSTNAGYGGRILQKTAIISNASTDLVLTIGVGANANTNNLGSDSTISGGLTLTTSDGYNGAGVGHNTTSKFTGEGINAYGLGGGTQSDRGGGTGQHGWGNGNYFAGPGGDGAILLYY